MSAAITEIRKKDDMPIARRTPRVFYTPDVWDRMWFLISINDKEVGWLGLVNPLPSGDYLVYDIFVPPQRVHGAETEIDQEAMTDLAMQLIDAGQDTNQLFYWGHSHVNMGVSPSGQDERQIDEYLAHCPRFIRGIYNKKGERKVDVFDRDTGVVYQCVVDRIFSPGLTEAQQNELRALCKTNVLPAFAAATTTFGDIAKRHSSAPPKRGKSYLPGVPLPSVDDDDDEDDGVWLKLEDLDEEEIAYLKACRDPFYFKE
jgi:hypothetical protein